MLSGDSNANSKAIICKPKLMSKDKKYSPRLVQRDHKLLWTFLSKVRGSSYSPSEMEDYNYRLPFWLGRFLHKCISENRLCIILWSNLCFKIRKSLFNTLFCFNEDTNFRYMHHFYFLRHYIENWCCSLVSQLPDIHKIKCKLTALVTQWMMTCSNVFWLNTFDLVDW